MKKIIFFSHNKNKINEIIELFKGSNINVLSLKNFSNIKKPEENGSSFKENSKIKSKYGFKHLRLPCFADDSGICISALKNLPGIKSKRYLIESGSCDKAFAAIISKTKKAIIDNRSILIFPHGTRTLPNSKNKIQSGVVILYKHLNIKVVPVKLDSGKYWGRNKFLKYPGKIKVNFLKPIYPGLSPGEFRKKLKKIL